MSSSSARVVPGAFLGKKKPKYYAYFLPESRTRGIVESWDDCLAATSGSSARYRGFDSRGAALGWLDAGAVYEDRKAVKTLAQADLPEDAVFFDSGTGRGQGTEVNVTDRDGTPLAFMVAPSNRVTTFGTVLLSEGRTNNYGELMGCYLAIKVAMKTGRRLVMGDSALVLEYWSRGRVNREAAGKDPDLAKLVKATAELRGSFEAAGGRLEHVPGGINPADLGFHRD